MNSQLLGYRVENQRVYDPRGNVLTRFVMSNTATLINLETYPLDDPWIDWTPVDNTGYEIDQKRLVRLVETEQPGYIWVIFNKCLWCVELLRCGMFDEKVHRSHCFGLLSCCSECGGLWKMYEQHQNKCWPCLLKSMVEDKATDCGRFAGKVMCPLDSKCLTCFHRSLGSIEQGLFWSSCNSKLAVGVFRGSTIKHIFDCPGCNHKFEACPNNVVNGRRCSYCFGDKLCDVDDCLRCHQRSFASHPKSKYWSRQNKLGPRQVKRSSHRDFLFDCPACSHYSLMALNNVVAGQWCRYCNKDSLCDDQDCNFCLAKSFASHPRSKHWSSKNLLKPRQVVQGSTAKCWFTCSYCQYDFCMELRNVTRGYWCSSCRNKTEKLLLIWLTETYPTLTIIPQAKFKWCRNPSTGRQLLFDFFVVELGVIIELDGPQHFANVMNWGSYQDVQFRDIYKMSRAAEEGLTVIRILQNDVWLNKYDWKKSLKDVIITYDNPRRILLDDNRLLYVKNRYDCRTLTSGSICPINYD
jgi:very-short-patch-repair endonuclease